MNSNDAQPPAPVTSATAAPVQTVPTANRTSGEAIASLVLGILAWPTIAAFGLGIVSGILAVIFGHLARSKIRDAKPPGSIDGDAMAIIGLVLGYFAIVIGVLVLLFFSSLFALFMAAAATS
ncbi:MAG: DUF4190 domain-containing protein [Xanthomonadales bacterium]|nr:DUF4190 domain-containing protein [Xanthomonadales bacterium]